MSYAPKPDTRGYQRVIMRGCGGYQDNFTLEFDCRHAYPWTCDDCPVVREAKPNSVVERGLQCP